MKQPVLLIGNDINNVNNPVSWKELLRNIIGEFAPSLDERSIDKKPFPLLYEEIYLKAIQSHDISVMTTKPSPQSHP